MRKFSCIYPQWFEKLTQDLDSEQVNTLWNQYDKLRSNDKLFVEDATRSLGSGNVQQVKPHAHLGGDNCGAGGAAGYSGLFQHIPDTAQERGWPGNVMPKDMLDKIDTKPTNPKDRAATNRLDTSLFPMSAIIAGTIAMTEGDCKYGGYNYREMGVCVSTYISALDRHEMKFYNGEWQDTKTWVAHLGSMIACCAILIDGFAKGNIIDDRPPRLDMTVLLDDAETKVKHLHELFPNGPARYTEVKPYEKQ